MNCIRYARPGKPLTPSDIYECAQVYASTDGGRSWCKRGDVNSHSDETEFLQLTGGRMLAITRYQRTKVPDDPSKLATPYVLDPEHRKAKPDCPDCKNPALPGGHSIYKQTASATAMMAARDLANIAFDGLGAADSMPGAVQ